MALDVEIGRLRHDAQLSDAVFGAEIVGLGVGKLLLQLFHLAPHLGAQMGQRGQRVEDVEATEVDDACEVGHREAVVVARAVSPHAPDEQREDGLAVLRQEVLKVEDAVVVERDADANLVERGRVALHVLDGVCVGVEHVAALGHAARLGGGSLQQVVVVGIDTGYHVGAYVLANEVHQHRLFAALQPLVRGQHDLKVAPVVLET